MKTQPDQNPGNINGFTDQVLKEVLKDIENIWNKLSFLINLSLQERRKLSDMNERRIPFVRKALEYARKEPGPLPINTDLDKLEMNLKAVINLRILKREIDKLDEGIRDTLAKLGSEGYEAALIIYNSYGLGRRTDYPGIDYIYNDLRQHFKRGGYNKKSKDTVAENDQGNNNQ
jgi:hypothetical protein